MSFSGFIIINLGKFVDITQEPISSDVIVCLAGDYNYRINKALELYKKGYSRSNKIILTGSTKDKIRLPNDSICKNKITYLRTMGVPLKNIVYTGNAHNTMQEIQDLKDYLLVNHLKSALIVSDSPHSRRIVLLANNVVKFNMLDLTIRVVSSDVPWWDHDYYYKNKKAFYYVLREVIKIPYNYFLYSVLRSIKNFIPFSVKKDLT